MEAHSKAGKKAAAVRSIRSFARSLLVLVIFIPVAVALPLAALSLCRTPSCAEILF
jgi:hypothetical protein